MTKELEQFYNMFTEVYAKMEKEIKSQEANYSGQEQMNQIRDKIEKEPSLKGVFPHLIKFL